MNGAQLGIVVLDKLDLEYYFNIYQDIISRIGYNTSYYQFTGNLSMIEISYTPIFFY